MIRISSSFCDFVISWDLKINQLIFWVKWVIVREPSLFSGVIFFCSKVKWIHLKTCAWNRLIWGGRSHDFASKWLHGRTRQKNPSREDRTYWPRGKSCMLALLREAIKHLFWTASHVSMGLLSFSHLLCPKWNVYGFVISNFEATKDHGFGTREWLAPQSPALMEQFGGAFTSLGQISNWPKCFYVE